MDDRTLIETTVQFRNCAKGRRELRPAAANTVNGPPCRRVPRVARLMALAIHFDQRLRDGSFANAAELARLGRVSRARMTQILNLLHLAPDIQEELLGLTDSRRGPGAILLRDLQPIAAVLDWDSQRQRWRRLLRRRTRNG